MEKNVTHMITFAKNLVGIANLMKFVMRTQNCVYISATTTTNVKAKIITVTEETLCETKMQSTVWIKPVRHRHLCPATTHALISSLFFR